MVSRVSLNTRVRNKIKIRKGDVVIVISGDDKSKVGKVIRVFPKKNKALVEGINKVMKHNKPTAEKPQGDISEKEALIHISNLALLDPKEKVPTRIRIEESEGKKYRVAKKSGTRFNDEIILEEKQ